MNPLDVIKHGRNEIPKEVEEKEMYQFMIDFANTVIGSDMKDWIMIFDAARQIINIIITNAETEYLRYRSFELAATAFVIASKHYVDKKGYILSAVQFVDNAIVYEIERKVLTCLGYDSPEPSASILFIYEALAVDDDNNEELLSLWFEKHQKEIISRLLEGNNFDGILSVKPTFSQLLIDTKAVKPGTPVSDESPPDGYLQVEIPQRPMDRSYEVVG